MNKANPMSSKDTEPNLYILDLEGDDLDLPEDLETVMQMLNMKTVYRDIIKDEH
jgi:hypothetical protein